MKKVSKTLSAHIARLKELALRIENTEDKVPQIDIDIMLDELRKTYDAVYCLGTGSGVMKTGSDEEEEEVSQKEEVVDLKEKDTRSEAQRVEQEDESKEAMSILMVDNTTKPLYAEEPEIEAVKAYDTTQPSMESLEGQPNDELFTDEPESSEPENTENETVQIKETAIEPEPVKEEPVKEEPVNQEPTNEEPANEEPANEEPAQTKEQPSLFDYFKVASQDKPVQRTLAETLGPQISPSANTATINKVQDLRTVININDKFSFMNELFHNNMKGYNDFILRLNAITNREEALSYVSSIAEQYGWDAESITVKTFYSIFDRKF